MDNKKRQFSLNQFKDIKVAMMKEYLGIQALFLVNNKVVFNSFLSNSNQPFIGITKNGIFFKKYI